MRRMRESAECGDTSGTSNIEIPTTLRPECLGKSALLEPGETEAMKQLPKKWCGRGRGMESLRKPQSNLQGTP